MDDARHSLGSFLQGKFSNLLKSTVTVPSPADVQGWDFKLALTSAGTAHCNILVRESP